MIFACAPRESIRGRIGCDESRISAKVRFSRCQDHRRKYVGDGSGIGGISVERAQDVGYWEKERFIS